MVLKPLKMCNINGYGPEMFEIYKKNQYGIEIIDFYKKIADD